MKKELMILNWATEEDLKTKKGIIYRIVNTINQKCYIGKATQTFKKRYKEGWFLNKYHNGHFKNAKQKYGINAFKIEILSENKQNFELVLLEKMFIKLYKSNSSLFGYNKTEGGEKDYKFSEETCLKISLSQRANQEDVIKQFKKVHGDKYDYSKMEYINCDTKIEIICPVHGSFWQSPWGHRHKNGCTVCSGRQTDTQIFIEKAKLIHKDKFDYSLVDYKGWRNKIKIKCVKHDFVFETTSYTHYNAKYSCPKCLWENISEINSTKKQFNLLRINQMDMNKNHIRYFNTAREAATFLIQDKNLKIPFNRVVQQIRQAIRRGCKSYRGYYWDWEQDQPTGA